MNKNNSSLKKKKIIKRLKEIKKFTVIEKEVKKEVIELQKKLWTLNPTENEFYSGFNELPLYSKVLYFLLKNV